MDFTLSKPNAFPLVCNFKTFLLEDMLSSMSPNTEEV